MTAGDGGLGDFSVAASFVDGQVILALQGEVDVLSAPEFGAFFETMIDRGHRSVVLDLAGLRFMDASGLAVIARGADRLEVTGGTLTIRAPVAMVGRMLDITGFARLVQLEPGQSSYAQVGPEQSGGGEASDSRPPAPPTPRTARPKASRSSPPSTPTTSSSTVPCAWPCRWPELSWAGPTG